MYLIPEIYISTCIFILQCHIVSSKWGLKAIYDVKHNYIMSCLNSWRHQQQASSCITGHMHVLPTERARELDAQRNIREHQINREPRMHIKHPPPTLRFTLSLYYSATASRESPFASENVCVWMVLVKVQFYGHTFSPLFSRRNLWSCQYKPTAFDLV